MDTEIRQIHNFLAGDLFDRHYRLLEHVGSGGFADVWKAKDELVDTIVALKIYTRLDKEGISELAKEYKEMRGIKHPNLLTGNHFDASGNIPYLEMDYCDGGSLYGKMGKMSNDELHHVLRDIAGGQAYLHREGIVHQDIKPENILYDTSKDRYLLSDFGISGKSRTRLSHSINKANMTLSMTEAYAPPEKFSGNLADIEPDTKGDLFSFGMTMFELSVGQLPFTPPMATGREMLYSQGRLQLDYGQIKDPVLRSVVEGCTKYDKTQRITAEEILVTMNGERPASKTKTTGETNTDTSVRPPTVEVKIGRGGVPPPPPPTPTSNHKWIYVVFSAFAVAIMTVLLWPKGEESDTLVDNPSETTTATTFTVNGVDFNMVYVEGGTYTMGCTNEQGGDCYSDDTPAHSVTVSGFYMGQTEVTQALWKAVMGSNPSNWKGNTLPVEHVSYNDVKEFIGKLNSLTGKTFRLPTEAEWEFAARGGNSSRGYKYSGSDNLGSVAWYGDNSGSKTHPVAQKQANELGLYDMSGNVWEWCNDWHGSYSDHSQSNPKGPASGSGRVNRGGSWGNSAKLCRVSNRYSYAPSYCYSFLGFRLALSAR